MNIHQALQNSENYGEIGPFEVTKSYPKKGGGPLFLLVKDASGQTAVKVWGNASNNAIQQGQVVCLVPQGPKAVVRVETDQGRTALVANDYGFRFEDASTQSAPSSGGNPAPRSGGGDIDARIVRQNALAHATALVVAGGVSDPKRASDLVLEIAPAFAHYSITGNTDYIPM